MLRTAEILFLVLPLATAFTNEIDSMQWNCMLCGKKSEDVYSAKAGECVATCDGTAFIKLGKCDVSDKKAEITKYSSSDCGGGWTNKEICPVDKNGNSPCYNGLKVVKCSSSAAPPAPAPPPPAPPPTPVDPNSFMTWRCLVDGKVSDKKFNGKVDECTPTCDGKSYIKLTDCNCDGRHAEIKEYDSKTCDGGWKKGWECPVDAAANSPCYHDLRVIGCSSKLVV